MTSKEISCNMDFVLRTLKHTNEKYSLHNKLFKLVVCTTFQSWPDKCGRFKTGFLWGGGGGVSK